MAVIDIELAGFQLQSRSLEVLKAFCCCRWVLGLGSFWQKGPQKPMVSTLLGKRKQLHQGPGFGVDKTGQFDIDHEHDAAVSFSYSSTFP